jgi:tetratricopeptide (TPR) repeat protein
MVDILNSISFLSSNWPFFLLLISIIVILIGRIFKGISIFQPLEEILYKQQNYRRVQDLRRLKDRMVNRNLDLGNSFLDAYNLEAAKNEFEKALNKDPTNIEAHMGLIKSEVFQPLERDLAYYNPDIAEKKIDLILKEDENDKHALLFLGIVYTAYDNEKALRYLNAAVLSDPEFAIAYSNIAKVYAMQNKNVESLATMEKAASLSKWNPIINNSLGYQYLINDMYEKAIEQLNFLLRFDPYFLIAYWNISNSYRMLGNFQLAYERQKKLIELLEDENVTSLKRNQLRWFFNIESDKGVNFYDLIDKKSYSYYSMALTCYLIDSKKEAQEYIDKAQELSSYDKISSLELLNFNIKCLKNKDSNLINKLDEFRGLPNLDL